MNGETVLLGKIYLVKIKTTASFKAPEILWAICQVGKSNVNVEDFRNIVEGLNGLGAYTESLSDNSITWRLLQNAIALKAIGKVGNPLLLTKEVCTFREVLEFAYDRQILTNTQALDMLALKDEELRGASNTSNPMTMKEATGRSGSKPLADAIEEASQNARNLTGISGGNVQPGSETNDLLRSVFSPSLDVGANETVGDATNDALPGVSFEFDASNFNIDEVDNEIEVLGEDNGEDLRVKLNRYKALTTKLRNSLSFSCQTVHQLTQALDAKDMQLRELKADGAKAIAAELQPGLDLHMENINRRLETIESDQAVCRQNFSDLSNCLSSFGFKGNPCTFDIPLTLGAMYTIMNNGGVQAEGQAGQAVAHQMQINPPSYVTQPPPAKQSRMEDAQTVSSVFQRYGSLGNTPTTPQNFGQRQPSILQHQGTRRSIFPSPRQPPRHGSN